MPSFADIDRQWLKLKSERDRLGGVNLTADDELAVLNEQYASLDMERLDVEGAIAKLRGAIGQLNREAKKRLGDAFETVNGHFQRLFTTLFGGGEARLEMNESEEDPLEGGLEIVRHAVLELDVAMNRGQPYVDAVRNESYQGHFDSDSESAEAARALDQLLRAVRGVDLAWHSLADTSPLAGLTLAEADVRRLTGASVVAIVRNGEVVTNPAPDTHLAAGDLLGLIGSDEQLRNAGDRLQAVTIST